MLFSIETASMDETLDVNPVFLPLKLILECEYLPPDR